MSNIKSKHQGLYTLSLAALGVVYGDIGTSPLYAMRVSLEGLSINLTNILGILSLIFWTLTAIVSLKYLILLLRADNDGEGGVLALLALIKHINYTRPSALFGVAIFGAGLLLGDGMLTPAISVLSAIEGLNVIVPDFSLLVLPVTCIILLILFFAQHAGTQKIGVVFGPLILLWFITLAAIGINHIIEAPVVLNAINPIYAFHFFQTMGWKGFAVLSGIFLVATGAEALYADLGHFGKRPIRLGWFAVALPALVINYLGQGALLLKHPEAIANPFYLSAPSWFHVPLLILATCATVIASQAIISATFSLVRQAVLLGLYPKLPIVHTSSSAHGQIYIPQMNQILTLGALFLVLTFKTANALTHAYGITVNLGMILTTNLAFFVAIRLWRWHWILAIPLFAILFAIDLAFLGANSQKILTGAWVPLAFAAIYAFIMFTWSVGRQYLQDTYYLKQNQLDKILKQFTYKSMLHLPGTTAIFITDTYDASGGACLNFLKCNRTLPEKIILINFTIDNVPHVSERNRIGHNHLLCKNISAVTLRYGFMDMICIPKALSAANAQHLLPFSINMSQIIYVVEIPNVVATPKKRTLWFYWQEKLFAFLVRNYSAHMDIEFYQLPPEHSIGMGAYYIV